MVQRNTPAKLGIIASVKNYVKSSEVLYKTVKPSSQTSDIRSKGGGAELKKIMKKSRSIKRSEPEASGSYPARRSKPQPKKLPPRDILPVAAAAASPKKPSQQSTKVAPSDVAAPAATLKKLLAQSNQVAAIEVATPVGAAAFSTPKKPSPLKLPLASPNYMKSTTSSSNARRERSQVSPQGTKTSFDSKNPCLNHRKLSRESGHKPDRTLTKTSSLRPVRTLTKTTSCKKKSGVSLYPDQNVERATCSSTLKDSKFPRYVMLHPGGTESQGTSVMKVCPYTYCSLNGHHHAQLPPLKHFMSARRRLLKTQKSMRQKNQSPNRIKRGGKRKDVDSNKCHIAFDGDHHPTIPEADSAIFAVPQQIQEVGLDCFVEIYAQKRKDRGDFDAAIDEQDGGKNGENMSDESLHSEISFEYDLDRYSDFLVAEMDISMIFPDLPADDAHLRCCAIGSGSKSTSAAESEDDEMIFETMDMDWEEGQVVDARHGLEADPAQTDDEPNLKAMSKCYEEVPPNEELQPVPAKNNNSLEAVIDDDVFSVEGGHHNSEIDLSSKVNSEEFILSNGENPRGNLSSDEDKFDEPIRANTDGFPDLEDSINTEVFSDPSEHPLEELNATYKENSGISQPEDDLHQEEALLQDKKLACSSINIEYDTQMEEKEECESLDEIEKDDTYSEDADAGHDHPQQQEHHENAEDQHEGVNLSISTCTFSEGQGDSERNKLKSIEGNKAGNENHEPDDKVEIVAAEEILVASDVTGAKEEITITNAGECDSDQELPGSNSSTNRRIRCKRPTTDGDEPREFNPREPHFLPVVPDPEAEKVDLRHQMMDERKNAEEWMVDFALRQAVNKLAPARKRRVALLVEAFETVNPVPKYKSHLQHTTAAFTATRFIQACS